jgi:hypothetical protein
MMRILGRINSTRVEDDDPPDSRPRRKPSKLRRKASQGPEKTISIVEAKAVHDPDPPHPSHKVHFKEQESIGKESWKPIHTIQGSDPIIKTDRKNLQCQRSVRPIKLCNHLHNSDEHHHDSRKNHGIPAILPSKCFLKKKRAGNINRSISKS